MYVPVIGPAFANLPKRLVNLQQGGGLPTDLEGLAVTRSSSLSGAVSPIAECRRPRFERHIRRNEDGRRRPPGCMQVLKLLACHPRAWWRGLRGYDPILVVHRCGGVIAVDYMTFCR
jgi:hypothetical protein